MCFSLTTSLYYLVQSREHYTETAELPIYGNSSLKSSHYSMIQGIKDENVYDWIELQY